LRKAMSQHHTDPVEENIETHPVKLAVAIAGGAAALITSIVLLASFAVGTHEVGADSKAMSPVETVNRIAPVARLVVEETRAPASAPVPAAAAPVKTATATLQAGIAAAVPAAALADGMATYSQTCSVCHGTGVAGAPKFGDKAAWAPRIVQGSATLHDHAIKGYQGKAGMMPAKGGNTALGDADVKAAADYMVSQAR
jgi:cytochrome c5